MNKTKYFRILFSIITISMIFCMTGVAYAEDATESDLRQILESSTTGSNSTNSNSNVNKNVNKNVNTNNVNTNKNINANVNTNKNINANVNTNTNKNTNLPSTGIGDSKIIVIVLGAIVLIAIIAFLRAKYYMNI